MYSHAIPTNVLWWALQSASAGLMTVLGMWACRWRELRPIRFGGGGAGVANAAGHGTGGKMEDEDGGWGRGRGRGREGGRDRGRDGGGEYEMVGMKGNGDGG